jgi:membrane-bound lytic murein transglycosylase D
VRKILLIACLGISFIARAQDDQVTLDDAVRSAQDWARDNLDQDTLRSLSDVDRKKVQQFLDELQKQFHGQYVINLAELRETARTVLPILKNQPETQPYAEWLETRLDYLDVAEQLRVIIPPPKSEPGKPPPPLPNPPAEKEREVWIKKLSDRPVPDVAKSYVTRLKPVFVEQQIPPQLVWIAEVESSFNPRARSPAGATGLFQLMPATAKQYGLRTWPFDQREHAEESARAAARHLDYLHKQFKDWRLTIAAYNAGEGTVRNLLKGRKTQSYDAIASRLPAETQLYVPKVEATILRREGVRLNELPAR